MKEVKKKTEALMKLRMEMSPKKKEETAAPVKQAAKPAVADD